MSLACFALIFLNPN